MNPWTLVTATILLVLASVGLNAADAQLSEDDVPSPTPRRSPTVAARAPADVLIEEFYRWYPCVYPSRAVAITKGNPQLAIAILASNRPERDRFAAYTLLIETEIPGYQTIVTQCTEDRSPRIRSCAIAQAKAIAELKGKDER